MKRAKPSRKNKLKIRPDDPVYAIGIVSKLLGMPEWTLRALEKEGLVRPKRLNRKIRVYSYNDLDKIQHIHYLMEEQGVNISGVKYILRVEQKSISF
jgi:MerR family transcriptional regulator, heat shock protein HspR